MTALRPQPLTDGYFSEVEDQIATVFYETIFAPLVKIIREYNPLKFSAENASTAALRRALLSGKVQYARGKFTGEFTLEISRGLRSIGAKFSKFKKAYLIEESAVPQNLLQAAYDYSLKARLAHQAIEEELNRALHYALADRYDIESKQMVDKVDSGWRRSAARLEVKPELTAEGKKILREGYTESLQLPIKRWMQDQILTLRRDVQENAEKGHRFGALVDVIKQRAGVSRRKAKFIARNETGIFMSKFRAQMNTEAGVTKYRWSTAHDIRVRPYRDGAGMSASEKAHAGNHRVLDGEIFDYRTKAPAKYMSVGRPCNPGEDYQCRCTDIPLP